MNDLICKDVLQEARWLLLKRSSDLRSVGYTSTIKKSFPYHQIRNGVSNVDIKKWIQPQLGKVVGKASIYRLSIPPQSDLKHVLDAFLNKSENLSHKYSKYNGVTDSNVLYVGSSHNIASRLKQHLNSCAKKTYALKMGHWIPSQYGEIVVEVSLLHENVGSSSVVQDIEDSVWRRSKPVFGKFGPQ